MAKLTEILETHVEIHSKTAPIGGDRELGELRQIASECDRRLEHLAGESDTKNTRLGIADAKTEASDKLTELDRAVEERWGQTIKETREQLMTRPALPTDPDSRLRADAVWRQLGAVDGLDHTMISALWPSLDEELKTALLAAPPRLVRNNGILRLEEIVPEETREAEMRERHPQLSARLDAATRAKEVLQNLANTLRVELNGKRR